MAPRANRTNARSDFGDDPDQAADRQADVILDQRDLALLQAQRHQLEKKQIHAAEQDRADVAAAREAWSLTQPELDVTKLVFIDETGTTTNMTRRYGRGPRDKRVIGRVPFNHRMTTTLVAGLRHDGIVAPLVLDRPMNGELFLVYLKKVLAPTLSPGDIVVMDNLPAHKVSGVEEIITACGAELRYQPPYSPDLNPIELAFAKLKTLLRQAGERTQEGLWSRIGTLLDRFSTQECANYLRHAGYKGTQST
jgi:transposase